MLGRYILLIGMLSSVVATGCGADSRAGKPVTVDIRGEQFTMELVLNDEARARGMANRTEFPPGAGMLFIFPKPQLRSFWMKDCLIDIDIIFLDSQGRVTATHRMKAEPPRRENETVQVYERRLRGYTSVYPVPFAIELEAGTLDRLNIGVDTKIPLDLARLKKLAR